MMDLEDGELTSSDNDDTRAENDDVSEIPDYVILDRPKKLAYVENLVATSSNPITTPILPANFSLPFSDGIVPKQKTSQLDISDLLNSDDDDDKDSSSDSDSDNGVLQKKRSRMTDQPPFGTNLNSNSMFGGAAASYSQHGTYLSYANHDFANAGESFRLEAEKFQKQRKPNPVWSNVIQEEQMSNIMDRVTVTVPTSADIVVDRGAESYIYQRPLRPPRPRRPSDSSDISSGGLSDNSVHFLRGGVHHKEAEHVERSEHSLPTSFTSSSVSKSGAAKKASKRKKGRQKLKQKLMTKLKNMKAPLLGEYLAMKLEEEKVQLLCRAIEIVGKESCIKLFLKTIKIERRGGIMIRNQLRRRTPGGVFLYLLRGDPRFRKGQVDLIFREDRVFHEKFKKKKILAKRLKRKRLLEEANEKPKEHEDITAASNEDSATIPDVDVSIVDEDFVDAGQIGDISSSTTINDNNDNEFESVGMQCDNL